MIGEKLDGLLKAKGMKAGTLASKLNVPKSTIYSIIKRNNKSMDLSLMERICDELNVPVEYFYDTNPTAESFEDKKITAPENGSGLSDKDIRLLTWFRSLPEEKQRAILIAQDAPEELF